MCKPLSVSTLLLSTGRKSVTQWDVIVKGRLKKEGFPAGIVKHPDRDPPWGGRGGSKLIFRKKYAVFVTKSKLLNDI